MVKVVKSKTVTVSLMYLEPLAINSYTYISILHIYIYTLYINICKILKKISVCLIELIGK